MGEGVKWGIKPHEESIGVLLQLSCSPLFRKLEHADFVGGGKNTLLQIAVAQQRINDLHHMGRA